MWQAIRWLVDYDGMANQLFRGFYRVNQSPVAQGVDGALAGQPYKLDVAKAKALPSMEGANLVDFVAPKEPYHWTGTEPVPAKMDGDLPQWPEPLHQSWGGGAGLK